MYKKSIIYTITLLTLINIAFATIDASKISHYYSFDNPSGSTMIDLRGTENMTSTGTVNASGKRGGGRDFESGDSEDKIEGTTIWDNADATNAIGFLAWVNFETKPSASSVYSIMNKNNVGGQDVLQISWYNEGGYYLIGYFEEGNGGDKYASSNDNTLCPNGNWCRVAITWDTTNGVRLYADGNKVNQTWQHMSVMGDGTDYEFTLGFAPHVPGFYFDGVMDEIILLNGTITDQDITDDYNSGDGLFYEDYFGSGEASPTEPNTTKINYTSEVSGASMLWTRTSEDMWNYTTALNDTTPTIIVSTSSNAYGWIFNNYASPTYVSATAGNNTQELTFTLPSDQAITRGSNNIHLLLCGASDKTTCEQAQNITILYGTTPIIATSRAYSPTNTTSDELQGHCKATDSDQETQTYHYKWYENGALNTTGNIGSGATTCFQQRSNQSNNCGAQAGSINNETQYGFSWTRAIDGDWDTQAILTTQTNNGYGIIWMNYTKPTNANTGTFTIGLTNTTRNVTLPENCFNENPVRINVSSRMNNIPGHTWVSVDCYNGASYQNLIYNKVEDNDGNYARINETGIYWEIGVEIAQNEEYNVNNKTTQHLNNADQWIISCLSNDGTDNTTWLNSSTITISEGYSNQAPTINSIEIYNATPTYEEDVILTGICTDNNETPDAHYKWYVNGTEITSGNNKAMQNATNMTITTLSSANYGYQATITGTVLCSDTITNTTWTNSTTRTTIGIDSCTPPAINNDWEITTSDNCTKTGETINLGTGGIYLLGNGELNLDNTEIQAAFFKRKETDEGTNTLIRAYSSTIKIQ